MKRLSRYLAVAAFAGTLAFSPAAWAGECCAKTAEAAKKGEACGKWVEHECCKAAAKNASKEKGAAKACAKCAKKEAEKSS